MRELTKIRLRTLIWLLIPVTVVIAIPQWLRHRLEEPWTWAGNWRQWLGVWLIANGLGLAAWCVQLFNIEGRGTPLPLDPPKRFVMRGPYRFVRNPMMLGMFVLMLGQSLLCGSQLLAIYTAVLTLLAHLFVCCWEEPGLARRFGAPYEEYRKQVPRWIPRVVPWRETI